MLPRGRSQSALASWVRQSVFGTSIEHVAGPIKVCCRADGVFGQDWSRISESRRGFACLGHSPGNHWDQAYQSSPSDSGGGTPMWHGALTESPYFPLSPGMWVGLAPGSCPGV